MILLLGGTTEAKEVAAYLDQIGAEYVYSTRTEVIFEGAGQYRYGILDAPGLKEYCVLNRIQLIINACHPFAAVLHATVATLAEQIPVVRFERAFPERLEHPLLHYMADMEDALEQIQQLGYRSMLALTGVQSIPLLSKFWNNHPCWFRILDRQYAVDLAARHHFPKNQLLFGPPQEREEEISLFRSLQPEVILTKESGLNGKLDAKIEAAIHCNIPLFIIKKPELSALFHTIHRAEDLNSRLP